ncbi:tRNA-dependent cyclodipeptide synthase [Sinosporangium siamense]|uniref:Cyclodipeptide synthase n=1 Tax=Sinosporangium siamense TaxID=1367973 RepID=A0A919VBA1_9ACTN|nr:tRNA-dependent cyclodipeptide synthase [Sinosporangium siamense]GII97218.1 cyclo(L-leucyl-L-leucyl) synthase [Sinosporangium siamense]
MDTVAVRPLSGRCSEIYTRREHVLIGVSALNGYFSQQVVTGLLRWAVRTFGKVGVLVPGPAELAGTLVAKGCEPGRAPAKARAAAGNTRNRVGRALAVLGVAPGEVPVLSWGDLAGDAAYLALRARVESLYTSDAGFREHCVCAVGAVVGEAGLERWRREAALPFLFAELPLVVDSPSILGVGSSLFCYPRVMPLVDQLYSGVLPISPAPEQGFLVTHLTSHLTHRNHNRQGGGR